MIKILELILWLFLETGTTSCEEINLRVMEYMLKRLTAEEARAVARRRDMFGITPIKYAVYSTAVEVAELLCSLLNQKARDDAMCQINNNNFIYDRLKLKHQLLFPAVLAWRRILDLRVCRVERLLDFEVDFIWHLCSLSLKHVLRCKDPLIWVSVLRNNSHC